MVIIEPADAVAIARREMGQPPEVRARISENAEGYLVSFDDGGRSIATMTSVWLWIDKATGDTRVLGTAAVGRLADSLRLLDL